MMTVKNPPAMTVLLRDQALMSQPRPGSTVGGLPLINLESQNS